MTSRLIQKKKVLYDPSPPNGFLIPAVVELGPPTPIDWIVSQISIFSPNNSADGLCTVTQGDTFIAQSFSPNSDTADGSPIIVPHGELLRCSWAVAIAPVNLVVALIVEEVWA